MAIHNNMQYVHELVLTSNYIIHTFHEYSHYSTKNYLL